MKTISLKDIYSLFEVEIEQGSGGEIQGTQYCVEKTSREKGMDSNRECKESRDADRSMILGQVSEGDSLAESDVIDISF